MEKIFTLSRCLKVSALTLTLAFCLPSNSTFAQQITVLSATWGGTDVTSFVAASCDGSSSCSYYVTNSNLGDPFPGNTKNFTVIWTCDGSTTYSLTYGYNNLCTGNYDNADGQTFTLDCGGGSNAGSTTSNSGDCGYVGCDCSVDGGANPTCYDGNSNMDVSTSIWESENCGSGGITVLSATWGGSDITSAVAASCDASSSCSYTPSAGNLGDPYPGNSKNFTVYWTCDGSTIYSLTYGYDNLCTSNYDNADGQTFTLDCSGGANATSTAPNSGSCGGSGGGGGISVTSATWGGTDVTGDVQSSCNGSTSCSYYVTNSNLGDPFPGNTKQFSVTWNCGGSSYTLTYGYDNQCLSNYDNADGVTITLDCSGGANASPTTCDCGSCGGGSGGQISVNATPSDLTGCNDNSGQIAVNPTGGDGANSYNINLYNSSSQNVGSQNGVGSYTFTGLGPDTYSVNVDDNANPSDGFSNSQGSLTVNNGTCGGITVTAASWGGEDVTSDVASSCDGQTTCSYEAENPNLGDPFPGNTKNFSVSWTCNGNNYSLSYGYNNLCTSDYDNADFQTFTLDCSGGSNPASTTSNSGDCGYPGCDCSVDPGANPTCYDGSSFQNTSSWQSSNCSGGGGGGINIESATYGGQDITGQVSSVCNGSSTCNYFVSSGTLGFDPFPDNTKRFDVKWDCGGTSYEYSYGYDDMCTSDFNNADNNAEITIDCSGNGSVSDPDGGQPNSNNGCGGGNWPYCNCPLDGGTYTTCNNGSSYQSTSDWQSGNCSGIIVQSATWGGQDVTSYVASSCNGSTSCSYEAQNPVLGDPFPGNTKNFSVTWTCSGSTYSLSYGYNNLCTNLYDNADFQTFTLDCSGGANAASTEPNAGDCGYIACDCGVDPGANPICYDAIANVDGSTSNWQSTNCSGTSCDLTGIPTNGLQGYYPLNGNTNDCSGNNFNGTDNGAASGSTGSCGTAYNFQYDYVDCGNPSGNQFDFTGDATISLWANLNSQPGDFGSYYTLIGKDEGGGNFNKWFLAISNTTLDLIVNDVSIGDNWLFSNPRTFVPGNFYHIVVTKSGNNFSFYVNGDFLGTSTSAMNIPLINASLDIGQVGGPTESAPVDAVIDEVALYNRVLDPSEILALYTKCDDGSGCTNSVFCNYDPNATIDDGTCSGNCSGGITVTSATWGGNEDVTSYLASACDGQTTCQYEALSGIFGDPYPNNTKSFSVTWTCNGNTYSLTYGYDNMCVQDFDNADNQTFTLDCSGGADPASTAPDMNTGCGGSNPYCNCTLDGGTYATCFDVNSNPQSTSDWKAGNCSGIIIQSATYGGTDVTSFVAASCDGQTSCQYTPSSGVLGDPFPGNSKSFTVNWTCSGTPFSLTYGYDNLCTNLYDNADGQTFTLDCGGGANPASTEPNSGDCGYIACACSVDPVANPVCYDPNANVDGSTSGWETVNCAGGPGCDLTGMPTSGLQGYYPLNGSTNDCSGNNFNGTDNGAASGSTGSCGTAYNFQYDYVDCGNPSGNQFDFTGDATISLWVNLNSQPGDFGSYYTLIGKDEGGGNFNKWFLAISNTTLDLIVNDVSIGDNWLFSNPRTFVPGNFYHIIVTKSGNNFSFYVNGDFLGTSTSAMNIPIINASLDIGEVGGGTESAPVDAVIDEVALYNRVLDPSEILALYTKCDDGSGCTNSVFCNYDPNATVDDGTCSGNCAGGITVTSATWGGNEDVTSYLASACDGQTTCQYEALSGIFGDPYPNNTKSFSVTWTCNANTYSLSYGYDNLCTSLYDNADNETFTLDCSGGANAPSTAPDAGDCGYTTCGCSVDHGANPICYDPNANLDGSTSNWQTNNCSGGGGSCELTGIPTGGLQGFYSLDGNTNDCSGNNFNGTANGATSGSTGSCGTAYDFQNDFVDCGNPPGGQFDFTGDATLSMWVNLNSQPGDYPSLYSLLGKDEGGGCTNKWIFGISNSTLDFHINDPSCDIQWLISNNRPFVPGYFYHIVVTKSGNDFTFYVNENSLGTFTAGIDIPVINADLQIGQVEAAPVDAIIDEVAVYNQVLGAPDIAALYTKCNDGAGCTNNTACNYDPYATVDDGTCNGNCGPILGCTDPTACNYDPSATQDDGSCSGHFGCTDPTFCNYDPTAGCDDGSCAGEAGCADVTANNYDPNRTCDNNNLCTYNGCTDPTACNYNPAATVDDGSCYHLSAPVISGNTAPLENTAETYTSDASNYQSIVWSVSGGSSSNGTGNADLDVNWGSAGTGTITEYFVDNIGCQSPTATLNLYIQTNNANPCDASVVPTSGLLGYYPLNGNAYDFSGNGFNGTVDGPTVTANGHCNKAYQFLNNYIDCGNPAGNQYDIQGDASIALWVKLIGNPGSGGYTLVGKDEGGFSLNKWIVVIFNNKLAFHINSPNYGAGYWQYSGTFNFSTNQFYHIVVTKSGNTYQFFVNGTSIGSAVAPVNVPVVNYSLHLGQAEAAQVNAVIDEVLIYGRVLSQPEINQVYNACGIPAPVATAGTSATSSSFIANWDPVPTAQSYTLDVSLANDFSTHVAGYPLSGIAGTSQLVTGLSPSNTYYYRVVANSTCGASPNSNTITYATLAASGTNTWLGGTTNWSTGTNWSNGTPPTGLCTEVVSIPTPTGEQEPVLTGTESVGNISLGSGASIDLGRFNLNVCGNITGGSGATDGDVLATGGGILVLNGSALQQIGGKVEVQTIQINNTGGVQLLSGTGLDIYTSLQLQAGLFDASNGTATLKSTSVTTAAIIDNFSNLNFVGTYKGNVTAERYYAAPTTANSYNQHEMGSPVNTPSLAQFGASGTAGYVSDANCDGTKLDNGSPYGTVFGYDETHGSHCGVEQWKVLIAGNAANGAGYSIRSGGPGTLSLTGAPNIVGNVTISGTNSGWSNSTLQGYPEQSGWTLASNPYPATLHISAGSISNNVDAGFDGVGVMVWNTTGGSAGSYQLATTLAPFQAFMVHKTNAGGSSTYTIYATDRVTTAGGFFKEATASTLNITATNQSSGLTDLTTVGFNQSATSGFDPNFDVHKIAGDLGRHSLYTISNNEWMYQNINQSIEQTPTVPMSFSPGVSGTYTLHFDGISSFDATSYITLEDTKTGAMYDVRNGDYTFTANASDGWNRFVLHFTPPASISTTGSTCSEEGMINIVQPGTAVWTYSLADNNNVVLSSGTLNVNSPVSASVPIGTYSLTLKDNNGYTVVKTVEVSGVQPVAASFTASANTVNVNQPVTFNSTSAGAVTNSWNFGDGTTDNGAMVTHAYVNEGVYNATLNSTSASGCNSSATNTITVTQSITGVTNLSDINNILIWSNEDIVNVDFTQLKDVQANIEIYNILGQKLSEDKYVTSTVYHKEIPNIEEGYIVVSVKNNGEIISKKLFISNVK